jgi:DNA-binding HxlR family transcriptional regulator
LARRYKQLCGLAVGLDVIGERWTLLIIRDLLLGPKRYSDLMAGLPGIGTNLLATRLKTLEGHGLIAQRRLPPPAASTVYELTESGEALEETVLALARWGMRFFSTCDGTELSRLSWPILGIRGGFDPSRAVGLDVLAQIRTPEENVWLEVRPTPDGPSTFRSGDGVRPEADIVAQAEGATVRELIFRSRSVEEALTGETLRLMGDPATFQRLLRVFQFSPVS